MLGVLSRNTCQKHVLLWKWPCVLFLSGHATKIHKKKHPSKWGSTLHRLNSHVSQAFCSTSVARVPCRGDQHVRSTTWYCFNRDPKLARTGGGILFFCYPDIWVVHSIYIYIFNQSKSEHETRLCTACPMGALAHHLWEQKHKDICCDVPTCTHTVPNTN